MRLSMVYHNNYLFIPWNQWYNKLLLTFSDTHQMVMKNCSGDWSQSETAKYFEWTINRASDISRKKKHNFAGFSGANSRKNRPISRYFRGKKVKIRGTISWLQGREVKIRRKIGPFSGILAEKSQFSQDFQGQTLRKIGRFHRKFRGGNFAKKQSVKNSRFRCDFFGKFG